MFYTFSGFIAGSVILVVIFKFIPPPVTPLMIIRVVESIGEVEAVGIEKKWVGYEDISPNLFRAVISGEDGRFMRHGGIDWRAVEHAQRYNKIHKGKRVHGASTITMQTAKNTFLWHDRNFIRKGLEVYFTYLIEFIWGKKRILEIYANVVEFGKGLYGAEAASQKYFNKPASKLTKREAALMAAVLPNPRKWSPARPTKYIEKRSAFIRGRMNSIALPED